MRAGAAAKTARAAQAVAAAASETARLEAMKDNYSNINITGQSKYYYHPMCNY